MAPKTFDDNTLQPQQRLIISNMSRTTSRHYQSSSTVLPQIYSRNDSTAARFNLNLNNNHPSRRFIPRRHRFISTSYHNMFNNTPPYDQRTLNFIPSRRSSSRYSFASNGSDTVTTVTNQNPGNISFNENNIINDNIITQNNLASLQQFVTTPSNFSSPSSLSVYSTPFPFNTTSRSYLSSSNNNDVASRFTYSRSTVPSAIVARPSLPPPLSFSTSIEDYSRYDNFHQLPNQNYPDLYY
ncbi:hypothetical protein C1645_263444 [Glomus cerebriforme]|uniref:Uncharacterized protein n=1 Tax=Glomus cerebriforme TaxID=658196 RepID=A0A397SY99_9GLOM|nr:hypothetical protein C1645_263444 [Glomus cerebriforme]